MEFSSTKHKWFSCMDNTFYKMKKLIIIFLLLTNCASVPQERLASDNIFDAVNINDNNPKRNKDIMKTLVFSTVVFILTTIAEK